MEGLAEKREKAFRLRVSGMSYRQIAKAMDCKEATAWRYVSHVLDEVKVRTHAEAEHYRTVEVERLDMALRALADQVRRGNLAAIREWRRTCESRRKLLGLDAPTEVAVTGPGGAPLITEVIVNKQLRHED